MIMLLIQADMSLPDRLISLSSHTATSSSHFLKLLQSAVHFFPTYLTPSDALDRSTASDWLAVVQTQVVHQSATGSVALLLDYAQSRLYFIIITVT
jgi:hypothetical protein